MAIGPIATTIRVCLRPAFLVRIGFDPISPQVDKNACLEGICLPNPCHPQLNILTVNGNSAGIPSMMKSRIAVVTVALSVMAAGACFGASPQMGTWKLNEGKSKFAPGMGKNTTVMYQEQKGDKVKVTVDGVDKDGKATHSVWVGKFDGKAYKAKGNLPYDMVAYKMVNDRTNEITAMKGGKTVWTGTIAVARDGKSRTVNISGTDKDGKKWKSKAVYDKS
jgi:hypothetical protein